MITPVVRDLSSAIGILVPMSTIDLEIKLYASFAEKREVQPSASDLKLRLGIEALPLQGEKDPTLPLAVEHSLADPTIRFGRY